VRYRVVGTVTITVLTDVEADSPAAAAEIAEGRPLMGLCWQCASGRGHEKDSEWRTSGELDGEPTVIEVDELDAPSEPR